MIFYIYIYLNIFSTSKKTGAKRIKIYSPYVIINQTGLALEFKSSSEFMRSDKIAAGQSTDSVSCFDCSKISSLLIF